MRRQTMAILAAGMLLLPCAGGLAGKAHAEQAAASLSNINYNKVNAPVLKPSWTSAAAATVSSYDIQSVTALAENGKVFILQQGDKLAALNASTGKTLWEFGSALAPLYTYGNGTIYGLTRSGALYAVSESGRKLWSAALGMPNASNIRRLGDTVYVTEESKLSAVSASTGKIKWSAAENADTYTGYGDVMEADGVILRSFTSQGALTLPAIIAYDAATGSRLWGKSRVSMPLAVKDGLVYSVQSLEMLDEDPVNRKIIISVLSLKSGELKGERTYRWTDSANENGVYRSGGIYGSAFLDEDKLYVLQGERIVQYDFWNYSADAKPLLSWNQPYASSIFPLNKVVSQRVLYYNNDNLTLSMLKLANGQIVKLPQGENPAVQQDLFGGTVYTGQSDGLFHAYDLESMKPLFTVQTGSREFRPTLKTGNMLIVRSGGKLLGVKLPSTVK